MTASALSLKARALRLLAQREHSRSELVAKLGRHVQGGDDLGALLDALQAKGFIDEARVAESVLHRRAPLLGTQRVLQELRRKGLGDDLVQRAAAQLTGSELERARAVWTRRFGSAPAADTPQERARQMRFLASPGFAADVVRRVVRGGRSDEL